MTVCPPLPVMFSRLISPSTAWERQQIDRLMNRMDRELTNLAPRLWDSILMGTPPVSYTHLAGLLSPSVGTEWIETLPRGKKSTRARVSVL